MSTLSKVFVVINMLLAFAFMIASLTLYAKKVYWVDQVREGDAKYNELLTEKRALRKEYDETKAKLEGDITGLEKLNIQLTQSNTDIKDANKTLEQANNQLTDAVSRISEKIESVEAELKSVEDRNKQLAEDLTKNKAERNKAVLAMEHAQVMATESLSDLKEAEAQLLELSKRSAKLQEEVLVRDDLLDRAVQSGFDKTAYKPNVDRINGVVLQVKEEVSLVILSVGERDNVKKGMEFVISRGAKYVGKVRVRNVYPDMCSATILLPLTKDKIEKSDDAQIM